jgi:hypothetical protein
MGLTDIYRTFHAKMAEHTLFSTAHGKFSGIDYMIGYKIHVNKF